MSRQGSVGQSRLRVGDKVRVVFDGYRVWYAENVPCGVLFEELGGDNMTVIEIRAEGIHVNGNGWGAAIPVQFLERLP